MMTEHQAIKSLWAFATFLIDQEGDIAVPIACFIRNEEHEFMSANKFPDKETFAAAIRQFSTGFTIVGLISSAWMVKVKSRSDVDSVIPSQHQNKEEIILITVKSRELELCEIASLLTSETGERTLGKITQSGSNLINRFFDGVFETVH